jgi:hypothetical protein
MSRLKAGGPNYCERCGKAQEGNLTFMIGASKEPSWCLCEGTGRFVCPDCYEAERADCKRIIDSL